jgi:cardiolipin synthase
VGGGFAYNFLVKPVEGEPSGVSKINTGIQLLYVLAVLSAAAYPSLVPGWTVLFLGSLVLVTTVTSGIDYAWRWGMRAYRVSHEPT